MPPRDEKESSKTVTQASEREADLHRLDRMLDEPVVNPRYGGMTMRKMVRNVVLRRDDSTSESE